MTIVFWIVLLYVAVRLVDSTITLWSRRGADAVVCLLLGLFSLLGLLLVAYWSRWAAGGSEFEDKCTPSLDQNKTGTFPFERMFVDDADDCHDVYTERFELVVTLVGLSLILTQELIGIAIDIRKVDHVVCASARLALCEARLPAASY